MYLTACPTGKPYCQIILKETICIKQTAVTSLEMSGSEDTCYPPSLMFVVLLMGILQGVEHTGSVYSIMPQW
jgi:hypothetical protein